MFKVEINAGNAAFDDGRALGEIASILRNLANSLDGQPDEYDISGKLYDINGNTVGKYYYDGKESV